MFEFNLNLIVLLNGVSGVDIFQLSFDVISCITHDGVIYKNIFCFVFLLVWLSHITVDLQIPAIIKWHTVYSLALQDFLWYVFLRQVSQTQS